MCLIFLALAPLLPYHLCYTQYKHTALVYLLSDAVFMNHAPAAKKASTLAKMATGGAVFYRLTPPAEQAGEEGSSG